MFIGTSFCRVDLI